MIKQVLDKFITDAYKLKVAVIGETIIDEFVPVSYEGQSMKSICPVFRLEGNKTKQIGGAGVIAQHLKDFVASVTLISNSKEEIVKTRYIDVNDQKKHVEINKFETSGFGPLSINTEDHDVVIVADFGHGFCNQLTINNGFHLMCQTNSNNFGFNRVSKWKKYKKRSICLDLREASLQMNKRINSPSDRNISELFNYEMEAEIVYVTTGKQGSIMSDGKTIQRLSSYPSKIVDTIGAGDAFYAFASLMLNTTLKKEDHLIVPSLAASLSTTWLCNEQSVTKEKLLKHAAQFI